MRSMTGMGIGKIRRQGITVQVEIRSVNHRFLDIVFRSHPSLSSLENLLRKKMTEAIARGRVTCFMDLERDDSDVEMELNEAFVEAYLTAARKLAGRYEIEDQVTLSHLLEREECFRVREREIDTKQLEEMLMEATDQALGRFNRMRETEGKALIRDLRRRVKTVNAELKKVRKAAHGLPSQIRNRLEERLANLGAADLVDSCRLAGEVAILADRASISEEIERLQSHVEQFKDALDMDQPVAKKLGFLLQEMHREINTTGSKSTDMAITSSVLMVKEELENMREQIQNLE